jgi:hypothetical protein
MAPDGFHHLEGTLEPDGHFRLYLYDDFTRPLDARAVRARTEAGELQASADGAFLSLPTPEGPHEEVELTVQVAFPASQREERFDFVLSRGSEPQRVATEEAAGPPAGPTEAAGLLEAIRARSRRVDELVRHGSWPDLFIPALEAKDLALALLEREGQTLALPVKTLVRAAWLLDLYGDLGRRAEVEEAHRLFQKGIRDLEKAHAR